MNEIRNLYMVSNGEYYTFVLVVAKGEVEAYELALESYKSEGRDYETLRVDLMISNIEGSVASNVLEV